MADLTAQQVIDRIRNKPAAPWKPAETLHAGSPAAKVSGIAATWAPSLEVLRRAVAAGKNMVVCKESPFWDRGAASENLRRNPTYQLKEKFIQDNGLTILRLLDNANGGQPDVAALALAKALGWEKYRKTAGAQLYSVPGSSLRELSATIRARLKIKGIRVIGQPDTPVRTVALTHGFLLVPELQKVLKESNPDAIIAGEPVEWEAGPYFHDLAASGQKKGMIVIGHEASEEPAMAEAAAWLKTLISEVPVEFLPAGEPFWVPKKG